MKHPPQGLEPAYPAIGRPPAGARRPPALECRPVPLPQPPLRALVAVAALVACAALAPAADRTVLSIGAHAGDAEITTGALLARHKRLGDRVVMLHLTLGEGGNPKMSPAAYGEQKKREALAAAQALGAEALFGPWKDGELRDTEEAARWVADVIRQVKPTHVITHWKASLHPDHEAAAPHRERGGAARVARGVRVGPPAPPGRPRRLLRRQLGGRRGLRARTSTWT